MSEIEQKKKANDDKKERIFKNEAKKERARAEKRAQAEAKDKVAEKQDKVS